jgi:hypothetical protein
VADKEGKVNPTSVSDFFKAYRSSNQAALAQVESNMAPLSVDDRPPISSDATFTSKLASSGISFPADAQIAQQERIKGLLYECYESQFKEVYAYQVNDEFCFAEHPEAIANQFGIPQQILANLRDTGEEYTNQDLTIKLVGLDEIEQVLQEDLTSQKQLIKDLVRDLRGTKLQDVYPYHVNDVLCLDEHPEAMAHQFGIPQQMQAGLRNMGYLYDGPTTTGNQITVRRIALQAAIQELSERILPGVWHSINQLSGTQIQSQEVYAYQVNDELRIVESPEAMAQALGLPETELAAFKDMAEEYRSRDIQGKAIIVKRIGLYPAFNQLNEQLASQKQFIQDITKDTEPLESLALDSGIKLADNQLIQQQEPDFQFELFLSHGQGKQTKHFLAEIQYLHSKIPWEKESWQSSKYSDYMNRFTQYKRKIIDHYCKLDQSKEHDKMVVEDLTKNINNTLLSVRIFLIEQHYRSFLDTPQGQDLAQQEDHHTHNRELFEQNCPLKVRREVNRLTIATYHFLREELVKALIKPHMPDEQLKKCIDAMKAHLEETNNLMHEQMKSLSKN